MTFKKIIGKIHLWLGLASGLVVFIVSITGCIYVFEKELKGIFRKDRLITEVEEDAVRLSTSILVNNAEALFNHKYKAYSLVVPTSKNETLQVHFFKRRSIEETGLWTWYGQEQQYYYIVYMNPYNGQLVYMENTKWELFTVVEAVHTSLLLGPIGNRIIAVSVLIFFVLLISGIILWWPHNKKALRMRTWFQWKPKTKWKRKNYDLHNIPGFYVLFLAVIISITGLSWS
ncbi:MAG: PepSY-associated TM helix domain-containing protein, partial [Bacteroidota bacterium]